LEYGGIRVMKEMKECLVLMPDNDSSKKIYNYVIKEVLENKGYNCICEEDIQKAGILLENIIKQINKSQLCIVDLTGNNPDIIYELGLAHGMLKNVIFIASDKRYFPSKLSNYHGNIYGESTDIEACTKFKNELGKTIEKINEELETGNPILKYLSDDKRLQDPEIIKELKKEIESKEQDLILQKRKLDEYKGLLNTVISREKYTDEIAFKKIRERKFEFKFIGQR